MAGPHLIPVEQALTHMLDQAPEPGSEEVIALTESLGRVLAQDHLVPADVPPADNSAVDGYALRRQDLEAGQPLPVSARIPAGEAPRPLTAGTAARIFTGSEIPPGADAVVMQERIERSEAGIVVTAPVEVGQNIRQRGQDLKQGDRALAAGTLIRPQEMGLLASMGIARVAVRKRLRVAVFSTGDELVEPGETLARGQIYNTNRFTLLGLLTEAGCEVTVCDSLKDDRETTRSSLRQAAADADLVITSGGVSVGEEDHVRAVLEESGELSMWRLAIKPGKPLAFGKLGNTPMLGLPGNPASVLVTFLILAMPFIRQCQGRPHRALIGEVAPAAFRVSEASVRREFVRARKQPADHQTYQIAAYPNQGSGLLSSACWAEGLAVVPENTTVNPGDLITYYSFAELLA